MDNALLNFFLIMPFMWISSKKFGAQLNPLFSVYQLLVRKIGFLVFVLNVLAQFAGSFAGRFFGNANVIYYPGQNSNLNIVFLEGMGALLLSLIYLFTTLNYKSDKEIYGFAYAAGVAALIICQGIGYYSRYNLLWTAFPALVTGKFQSKLEWCLLGNVSGSALAFLLFKLGFEGDLNKKPEVVADDANPVF